MKIEVLFQKKAKGSMDLLFCQVFKILRDGCALKSIFIIESGNHIYRPYLIVF